MSEIINEFDEMKAVAYMRQYLPEEMTANYSDDDLLLFIDVMFEFFDQFGDDDDYEFETEEVVEYIKRQLKRDKENKIAPEHIEPLVEAELAYEESIDFFDD